MARRESMSSVDSPTTCGAVIPSRSEDLLAFREIEIVSNHHLHQFPEANARHPAELASRLRRVPSQRIDLGRSEIAGIDLDVVAPIEACFSEASSTNS